MRIRAYRGDTLAASFDWGGATTYYGEPGAKVRAALAAPRWVRNPWSGEVRPVPDATLPDTWQWWASKIAGTALKAAGFRVELLDVPLPEPLPAGAVG